MIKSMKEKIDFEKQQYYTQANLVYISAFFAYFIFIPIFVVIGNSLMVITSCVSFVFIGLAIYTNRKHHYRIASHFFIGVITLQTCVEVILFGLGNGFMYYFFNLSALIIYTKWNGRTRFIGVLIEIVLAFALIIYTKYYPPVIVLSAGFSLFFHLVNIVLNVAGVTNSANFYINIVKTSRQRLEKLAMHDYLTGLPNRNALHDYTSEFSCKDNTQPHGLGVVMIDIDFFKRINDTHGHLMGDMVLKQTALLFLQHAKENDFVCRYGGEEFLLIVHISSEIELLKMCEHLRKDFEQFVFSYHAIEYRATISLGAIFTICQSDLEILAMIEKADSLVYQAKEQGRNRVVSAS